MDLFKMPDMPDFGGLIPDMDTKSAPEIKRDRYGFVLHDKEGIDIGLSVFGDALSSVGSLGNPNEKEQIATWRALLDAEPRERPTEEQARGGIPDEIRAEAWHWLSGASTKQQGAPADYYSKQLQIYQQQRKRARRKTLSDIDKDVDRTFPECSHFEDSDGHDKLRRVLGPYAVRNRAVGYCQSMNYLAGTLMLFMDEEQAFWNLCAICESAIPCFWRRDLLPLLVEQKVFKTLLHHALPQLSEKLAELGVSVEALTTQWFLCIFINTLPMEMSLRIWDSILSLGNHVLLQVSIGFLSLNRETIMQKQSLDEFVEGVKELTAGVTSVDVLLDEAFDVAQLGGSGEPFSMRVEKLRQKYKLEVIQEAMAYKSDRTARLAASSKSKASGLGQQQDATREMARSLGNLALLQRKLGNSFPTSLQLKAAPEMLLQPVRPADAHVMVVGLRGVGKHVAMMLACSGIGKLSLVDGRRTVAADVDRKCVWTEHHTKLHTVQSYLADAVKESISAVLCATTVTTHPVAVGASAAGRQKLQTLLSQIDKVDCIVCCADLASILLGVSRTCTSLARPWVTVSLSKDGRKGSVATVLPGQSACAECAQPIPESLVPAQAAVAGNYVAADDALPLVTAFATQQVVAGLARGRFEACGHSVDATQPAGGVVATHKAADGRCQNVDCQSERRRHAGGKIQALLRGNLGREKAKEHVEKLVEAEITAALGKGELSSQRRNSRRQQPPGNTILELPDDIDAVDSQVIEQPAFGSGRTSAEETAEEEAEETAAFQEAVESSPEQAVSAAVQESSEVTMPRPEGAMYGQGVAENGCGWVRPEETMLEAEKKVYNASMVTADTQYCHHFNEAGQHLVLHGLPSSDARHCCGVVYMGIGWSGKKLTCKEQRRPTIKKEGIKDAGHDKCNAANCAFVAEGKECPYCILQPKQK